MNNPTKLQLTETSNTVSSYLFDDDHDKIQLMPDKVLVPLTSEAANRCAQSKYGMLEIFRSSFTRAEAVLNLRQLSKKYFQFSKDSYLENFGQTRDNVYIEIRTKEDLKLLESAIQYCKIINCPDILQVEVFYKFPKLDDQKEEQKHVDRLLTLLASSYGYEKLTVGSDINCRMPLNFLHKLLDGLIENKVKVEKLILDLQYFGPICKTIFVNDHVNFLDYRTLADNATGRYADFPECYEALEAVGDFLSYHKLITEFVFIHGRIASAEPLRILLQGTKASTGLKRLAF